jgi:thiol-disulfide isomerase/thioredoxin
MDPSPRRPLRLLPWILLVLVVAGAGVWYTVTAPDAEPEAAAPDDGIHSLQELAEQAPETPDVGEPAPDFSVRLFDGESFSLADHLENDGRPVIVNLWASWCTPCRREMPLIDAFAAEHPEVAVLGVAVLDDIESAEDFAGEIGVSYPLGYDDREQLTAGYQVTGLPATFWIDGDGDIVKRLFGVVTEESLEADLALFE